MTQHVVKGTIQMCYMIKVGCSDIIQLKAIIQDRNSSVQVINGYLCFISFFELKHKGMINRMYKLQPLL